MGQCVSQKAASAFQRPVTAHHRKKVMHKNIKKSPDYGNNTNKKISTNTKGIATSFGFRRRPVTAPAIANNATAAKRLAKQEIIDRNGNAGDTESLTNNAIPPGRTTPKLAPPKKEANATRINRFGFRQPNANRLNKISDINAQLEIKNNNRVTQGPQQLRFTLQSTQLPKPQFPVHVIDAKAAKTLANNCKRASRMYLCENNSNSSKDGSFTEDSGVGSHTSSGNGESDTLQGVDLNDSPTSRHKARRFDMVVSGFNFDLRDVDDTTEPLIPLPSLPSVFQHNSGMVHNRRFEYEKQLQRRKLSTSSDGFSDDYNCNLDNTHKTFLKTSNNIEVSPLSSDQEWSNAGEAMADDFSYSCSSSDEISTPALALQNFMNASITKTAPLHEIRNVLLTIEDPKFAAVANNIAGSLLDDETSPVDSLVCSYSESEDLTKHCKLSNDNKTLIAKSVSNSKDVDEKDGSSSPGTPTNASNSLSLSDGKDYFDDEIADQPALVFDDTPTTTAEQISENTPTLIDSTPKPKRKFLGSPLMLRKRSLLNSTASVDTLSPCESIASDDLMMDFEQSQSSGLDDTLERIDTHVSLGSLEGATLKLQENRIVDSVWAVCVGRSNVGSPISTARPSRLLRSRGSTSSGSKPDSPCSFEGHISSRNCHSLTRSPIRLPRSTLNSLSGYDSDDSIKLDRANHGAMIQDVVQIKTMLIKLRRILNEQPEEDYLKKSDTLNPFDNTQPSLKNGLFNGLSSETTSSLEEDRNTRFEMAELRRQVLFLQGQLEDKEQSLHFLHEKMEKLVLETETAKSAPASTVSSEVASVNAATQTERIRPISAGPSLLQVSPAEGSMGSLVSVSERKSRSSSTSSSSSHKRTQPSLWRKPGEPPLPQIIYGTSNTSTNIPKLAKSRTRAPLTPV